MDLRDLLKEYWPIVAGVFAVLLTAVVMWPSDKSRSIVRVDGPTELGSLSEGAREALEGEGPRGLEGSSDLAGTASEGRLKEPSSSDPDESEMLMLEIVRAVPSEGKARPAQSFKTDDPEVQKALSRVKVVFYQEADCETCESARAFLEKNGVPMSVVDVEGDSNQRERARRLSGQRQFPVIVVDGKVLNGFSQDSLQAALLSAVKERVSQQE